MPLTALTAAITLVVCVADLIASRQSFDRIGLIDATIQDTDELRDALKKPLEGVWDYEMEYTRLPDREGNWIAKGTAIFIWTPSKLRYDVYLGASLSELGGSKAQLITWNLQSSLDGDQYGWPSDKFDIIWEYKGHTSSVPEWESPGSPIARFLGLTISEKTSQEATEIFGKYETPVTYGEFVMKRID